MSVKCSSCGGKLEGSMTFCPFCGVRQDVNLRQIHFRDLGTNSAFPCPHCVTPLDVIEFDTSPPMQIERCTTCFGMFFNPGELESLLDAQTNPLIWLDPVELNRIVADFGHDHEIVYRKCPMCAERMSPLNFGGHSGVILDRCGTHGLWLEGSELRRLTEWWRAGGKLLYKQHEAERAKRFFKPITEARKPASPVTVESPPTEKSREWKYPGEGSSGNTLDILTIIGGILAWIAD